MNFELNEEQLLLRATLERVLSTEYGFERRRRHAEEPDGWSRAVWARLAELGLLGLPFEQDDGGFGGGPLETMIAMEAFGGALLLEPYLATVVMGGACLRHGTSPARRGPRIRRIAAGSLCLAFAWMERQSRYDPADVRTIARRDGASWLLDGEKSLVVHGDAADEIVVTARVSGAPRDRGGIGVFVVNASAPGVRRRAYSTHDGLRAAEVALEHVRVDADDVLGEPGDALPLVERVIDEAIAAQCAEAVGVMAAMQSLTLEHLKARRQFGRTIGEFQALQHRAVDQLIALEQARSMALYASMMVDAAEDDLRRRAVSAAKVQIGRSGRRIGEEAIQLHGGIGMTMEYRLGHYFKRMTMIDRSFGDADWHLAALARAGGLFEAEG